MQSNIVHFKIAFLFLLIMLYPAYGKNVDINLSKTQLNLEKKEQDLDTNLIQILKQSTLLAARGEKKKDFNYILNFINNAVNTYGEDSEYTVLGYLVLIRHYIAFHEFENANALFTFIEEIKENQRYENSLALKALILHLKSDMYIKNKEYSKAYSLLSEAIKTSKALKMDFTFRISLFNSYIRVLTLLERYRDAEAMAKKTLSLYKKTAKDNYAKVLLVKTFINYGKIYEQENNYLFAYKTMDVGLSILSHEKALGNLSIPLLNFFLQYAMYSYVTLNYKDTIFSANMAMEIEDKLKIRDRSNKPYMWELIGLAYAKQQKYKKAKKSYEKALQELEKLHLHKKEKEKITIRIKQEINSIKSLTGQSMLKSYE